MTSALDTLRSRSPFAWLRERDIDLLLCSELHADRGLTRSISRIFKCENSEFAGAWVSHAEEDGESDLVVAFSKNDQVTILLIENKIAASFQPKQSARYLARAIRWQDLEDRLRVVTVLIAPKDYMSRPGAEIFDARITYEDIATILRDEKDVRSMFLANALEAGVEAYRQGYVMNPDENVSRMWIACWEIGREVAPFLKFEQPSLKPSLSNWIYFRLAEGFSEADRKKAVIVWKAERGQADLQFSGTTASDLAQRVNSILTPEMRVVSAGKSASIRLSVPSIDFQGCPEEQSEAITDSFKACERLRSFFVKNKEKLFDGRYQANQREAAEI